MLFSGRKVDHEENSWVYKGLVLQVFDGCSHGRYIVSFNHPRAPYVRHVLRPCVPLLFAHAEAHSNVALQCLF